MFFLGGGGGGKCKNISHPYLCSRNIQDHGLPEFNGRMTLHEAFVPKQDNMIIILTMNAS